MKFSLLVAVFFACVVSFTSATGVLHTDEITGYSSPTVNIPNLETDHTLTTFLRVGHFQAIRENGFNLQTVGGINFNSDDGVSINTPGKLDLKSTVGGDISIRGSSVDINAAQDIILVGSGESIFSAKEDINFVVKSPGNGTFGIHSNLKTSVAAKNSLTFSSSAGDVRFEATNGVVTLHADSLGLVGGVKDDNSQLIDIQSFTDVLVRADREFDLLAHQDVHVTAHSKLIIDSTIANVEFEAGECLTLTADSNIYISASETLKLETLLGDVSLDADLGVSLHGKGIEHFGRSISLSAKDFEVQGSGSFSLFSNKDNTFFGANTLWVAFDDISFIGKSDADIVMSLIEVEQYSSEIIVQTANLENSFIKFQAGYLTFQTFNDDIHIKSDELTFNGNIVRLSAGFDFNLSSKIDAFTPAGIVNAEEGIFSINSGLATTFTALDDVIFRSNYILSVTDDISILNSALDTFYFNGIFQTNIKTTDLTIQGAIATSIEANNDLFTILKTSYTLNSAKDLTIQSSFDNSFTYDSGALNPVATTINTNGFAFSATARKNVKIEGNQDVSILTSTLVDIDASKDDNSFTGFNIKNDMTVGSPAGSINNAANYVLTYSIPSGSGSFSAGRDINFNSEDNYITSVTSSIHFNNGELIANSDSGIYFRAGSALDFDVDDNSIVFTSSSVLIDSATSVNTFADQLIVRSTASSVNFNADNSVVFNSLNTLNLSPKPNGDIDINGGQVAFSSDEFNGIFNSLNVHSGDENNIEFDVSQFSANAEGDANVNSNYVNLYGEDNILMQAGDSILIETTKEDIIFDNTQGSDGFTILAQAGDAAFVSDYLSIETRTFAPIILSSGGSITFQATSLLEFTFDNSVTLTTGGPFTVTTGGDFNIQMLENKQELLTTYLNNGKTLFKSCNDDTVFSLTKYDGTINGDFVLHQLAQPCQPDDVEQFSIITHSDDVQTISSVDQFYYGDEHLIVSGGRVYVTSTGNSFSLKSASEIEISSINGDDLLADTDDDRLYSGENVFIDADSSISFTTVGFSDIANSEFNERGLEFDTNSGLLNFTVPTAGYNVTAPEGLIQIVSGRSSDIILWDTHDLIIEGGLGSVVIESGGNNLNDTVELQSSLQFFAAIGNILLETENADIQFESSQIFVSDSPDPRRGESYDAGLVVESFLGAITYTAGGSIDHSSSEMDGDFIYQSLSGKIDVNVQNDLLLHSGDRYFDGSTSFTAARNFEVTSLSDQKFITNGPNKQPDQNAIHLFGEEGPILFTTPSDQQFFISGSSLFDAATGQIILTAQNDITLDSTSELHLLSMFDSTLETVNGNIAVTANGGGGSVDIISDSAQSITGSASNSLLIYSEDSTSINSRTGITLVTQFNNVLLNQFGNYQNSFIHSGGSIVLEAERQDGVSFTSNNNINLVAQKDVHFDATQLFSIGSTGETNTGTEPIISFNAGDGATYGLEFDVLGSVDWTTLKFGPISYDSHRASWTSTGRQDYTSDGPVLFKNSGLFDLSTFEIATNALFSLKAGGAAELLSNDTVILNTVNSISFTATGGQNSDTSYVKVNNDWVINAIDHLNFQTNSYESVLIDWSVTAGNLISFSNTVGDGGSLSFISDWFFRVTSQGPISIQSNDLFNVYTDGADADINFLSSDDQTITSGSSISVEGKTIDFDSPNSVTITTTDGDIEFVASGSTSIVSNGTSSYTGFDSVTIQAGYSNTQFDDLKSFLNISSRGDLIASAKQAVTFEVTEDGEDITVYADKNIELKNSVPTRPSDQGDILVTTSGTYYFESGDDSSISAGRDIEYQIAYYELLSVGSQQYTASATGADIYFETGDDIDVQAKHDFNLAAFTTITINAEEDFTLTQMDENGPGAISFRTTGVNAPISLTSEGMELSAQGFVFANTDGYMNITSGDGLFFETGAYGADITFQNKGTGGLFLELDLFDYETDGVVNGKLFIDAKGIPSDTEEWSLQITAEDIQTSVNDRGTINYIAEDIELHNPKTTSQIAVGAGFSIHTLATGVNEDRFNRPYGILIEADDTISIDSKAESTSVNSNQGRVYVVASEDLTFDAGQQISGYAGDKLLISTGFTVEPNFQIPFRSGIIFSGTSRSSYRANRGDIIFDSEDASWSSTGSFNIRSDGHVNFNNPNSDTQWTAGSVSFNANNIIFDVYDTLSITATAGVNFVAREGIDITGIDIDLVGTQGDINLVAANIVFLNDNDFVVAPIFQQKPSVVLDTPYFAIPGTTGTAGISRITANTQPESDKFRPDEENNWPTCEDRQFTFDFSTGAICYCNYHKWRCNDDTHTTRAGLEP